MLSSRWLYNWWSNICITFHSKLISSVSPWVLQPQSPSTHKNSAENISFNHVHIIRCNLWKNFSVHYSFTYSLNRIEFFSSSSSSALMAFRTKHAYIISWKGAGERRVIIITVRTDYEDNDNRVCALKVMIWTTKECVNETSSHGQDFCSPFTAVASAFSLLSAFSIK